MRLFGVLQELVNIVFRKNGQNITLRPNNATTYTADRIVDIPPGDSDSTLVGQSNTQTLTNKTIDADSNTITNIENADIKAGANIARDKLASGSANHVLINDASGVFSSEAQLATSRGGTGVNSTATFPTAGVVLTRDSTDTGANRLTNKDLDSATVAFSDGTDKASFDLSALTANRTYTLPDADTTIVGHNTTQTLTNKTLQEPVIDNFADFNEETSASTPPAGKLRAFAKTDKKLYLKDSDGNELQVGSGGAGGRNYLEAWFDGNKSPGTLSTVAENGNVTTDDWYSHVTTPFTLTSSTSSPLRQMASFVSGSNTSAALGGTIFFQTPRFQIDQVDLGKPLKISFDISGPAASGDWDVIVIRYNSSGTFQERIPVAGNLSAATLAPSAQLPAGVSTFSGFFIPSSTATDYYAIRFRRLAGSEQLKLDSIRVSPQQDIIAYDSMPIGTVVPYVKDTPPSGWLVCDGSAVSRTTYYELFSLIGITHGQGDGSTTFNLPDYRGRFLRGVDGTAGRDPDKTSRTAMATGGNTGNNVGSVQGQATRKNGLVVSGGTASLTGTTTFASSSHTHTYTPIGNRSYTSGDGLYYTNGGTVLQGSQSYTTSGPSATASVGISSTAASISNGDSETRPVNAYVVYIIKATSSTGTILANRAVEEFAANDNTGVAANTTYTTGPMVYGPNGVTFKNVTITSSTATTVTSYEVEFQTPILPTDRLDLEVLFEAGARWMRIDEISSSISSITMNGVLCGMRLSRVGTSNTRCAVLFSNAGRETGASYGTAQTNWSSGAGNWRWRVRKVSGGAAVGFPVSARNIVGDTSGTAVPAGMIGERVQTTSTALETLANPPTSGTIYDIPGMTLTLQPGVWDISAHCWVQVGLAGASTPTYISNALYLRQGSTTLRVAGMSTCIITTLEHILGNTITIVPTRVSISTPTTYKLSAAYIREMGSGGTVGILYARGDMPTRSGPMEISAVRIA